MDNFNTENKKINPDELKQMRILIESLGWQEFMFNVGCLMAEQSDKTPEPQSTALFQCSRTIHALDKCFADCGRFQYSLYPFLLGDNNE